KSFSKKSTRAFAKFLAGLYSAIFRSELEKIEDNMRRALPENATQTELKKAAREMVENYATYLVELFYTDKLTREFVEKNVEIRGREHLDRALEKGRGVILASGHLGHWEIGGMTLAKLGYPLHAIALKHKDPRVDRIFQKRRGAHGLKIILLGASLKECFRILKENKVLALNADRLFGEEGVPVNFMGKTVSFPKGIVRLSLMTGAPVVPVFFLMRGNGRYLMEIEEPLPAPDGMSSAESFAARLEEKIRQHPTQWFIFQRFWEPPQWPV
ncbi:MAG: hypothetical protein A3J52_01740, partial [Omnitrophica bacterium RIFCSPHIGHO2_02_FULL_49_9]